MRRANVLPAGIIWWRHPEVFLTEHVPYMSEDELVQALSAGIASDFPVEDITIFVDATKEDLAYRMIAKMEDHYGDHAPVFRLTEQNLSMALQEYVVQI